MATAMFSLGAAAALAHPGHALNARSLSHTLTSPYHLATLGLIGAGLLFTAIFVKHLAARRALQFSGAAALGLAAVTVAAQYLS